MKRSLFNAELPASESVAFSQTEIAKSFSDKLESSVWRLSGDYTLACQPRKRVEEMMSLTLESFGNLVGVELFRELVSSFYSADLHWVPGFLRNLYARKRWETKCVIILSLEVRLK